MGAISYWEEDKAIRKFGNKVWFDMSCWIVLDGRDSKRKLEGKWRMQVMEEPAVSGKPAGQVAKKTLEDSGSC